MYKIFLSKFKHQSLGYPVPWDKREDQALSAIQIDHTINWIKIKQNEKYFHLNFHSAIFCLTTGSDRDDTKGYCAIFTGAYIQEMFKISSIMSSWRKWSIKCLMLGSKGSSWSIVPRFIWSWDGEFSSLSVRQTESIRKSLLDPRRSGSKSSLLTFAPSYHQPEGMSQSISTIDSSGSFWRSSAVVAFRLNRVSFNERLYCFLSTECTAGGCLIFRRNMLLVFFFAIVALARQARDRRCLSRRRNPYL